MNDASTQNGTAAKPQAVFIIGCPRSGTTFLQHALASHPDVLSLPETDYFERILKRSGRWLAAQAVAPTPHLRGLASGRTHFRAPPILRSMAHTLGLPRPRRIPAWSLAGYAARFTDLLDRGAQRHGRRVWIEKSPIHIAYVDVIAALVPDAKFIHILRNGEDVLASIVGAGLQFEAFDKARGFDHWIPHWLRYWNRAMQTHLDYLGHDRHLHVCHEDLLLDFDGEIQRLRRFVGLADPPPQAAGAPCIAVTETDREPWKAAAVSGLPQPTQRKFEALFGPVMQTWLRRELMQYAPIRRRVAESQGRVPRLAIPAAAAARLRSTHDPARNFAG